MSHAEIHPVPASVADVRLNLDAGPGAMDGGGNSVASTEPRITPRQAAGCGSAGPGPPGHPSLLQVFRN